MLLILLGNAQSGDGAGRLDENPYVQGAAIIPSVWRRLSRLSLIDLENLGDLWKVFVIGNILLQFLLVYAARHRRSTASVHGSIWA